MGSGDAGYARMKRKPFCAKLIAVRPGDITRALLRPEKYGKPDYSGELHKKPRINTVVNVIYVNSWGNLRSSQECHTNMFFRWIHSKNGVWFFSVPLCRQQHGPAISIFS